MGMTEPASGETALAIDNQTLRWAEERWRAAAREEDDAMQLFLNAKTIPEFALCITMLADAVEQRRLAWAHFMSLWSRS